MRNTRHVWPCVQTSILWMIVFFVFATAAAVSQDRIAVVVGNGEYDHGPVLENPTNDAESVGSVLSEIGYTTRVLRNATASQIMEAVDWMKSSLQVHPDSVGVFYYAGHGFGVQSGDVMMVPVDADPFPSGSSTTAAVSLRESIDSISDAGNLINVVFFDAATQQVSPTRGIWRVSHSVLSNYPNAFVVYSSNKGSTPMDGGGLNSPFVESLLPLLRIEGLPLPELFSRLQSSVETLTGGSQIPQSRTTLNQQITGQVALNAPSASVTRDSNTSAISNPQPVIEEHAIGMDGEKKALIIANQDYRTMTPLTTPISEAQDLSETLERIGFNVSYIENANQDEMLEAIDDFHERLRTNSGIAFFHYGGHGVQEESTNYMIPVGREIPHTGRLPVHAVSLNYVLAGMENARTSANLVFLDACRDSPIPRRDRTTSRGLARVAAVPPNSVIVFSANSGEKANDGVFTPALTEALQQPNTELTALLRDVRRQVYEITEGQQRPGSYDQLIYPVYLNIVTPIQ